MPEESFNEIRTRVLTDNTAQGVLNHLNALESNRAHVLTRWVWELLQNARDASIGSYTELVASVEQNEGELIFRHNGADFKIDEIAHLIYHGSTKVEQTNTIGQYGSGFLATHLLSPEIDVSGLIEDGRCFEFALKREIGSVSELSQSMEQAWKDFEDSLRNALPADNLNTQFRYPLNSDAVDAVEKGIATLKQCAPFVVVFNQEFSSIDIKSTDGTMRFTVTDRFSLEQGKLYQVTVEVSGNGVLTEQKYLLAQGEKASVAIPLESGDNIKCLPVGEIPKLFLGFPLVGTENFGFPAVINSLDFTPTENRDGVYLAQGENEANIGNQEVIEEACGLLVGLLQFSASSGWRNANLMTNIPAIPSPNWLNRGWMRECLNNLFIKKIRQSPVVLNEAGEAIPPDSLEIPLANTHEGVVALWSLLDGWEGAQDGLPRRDEAVGWSDAAKSWAQISGDDVSSFSEVIDGRKLAKRVQEVSHDPSANQTTHRVSRLNLKEGGEAINWLDQFIGFLNDSGMSNAVREYRIVPSQEGFLRTFPKLNRDCGIDDELKNIADLLDWRIRANLRDVGVTSLNEEPGAGDWDNDYVIGELIKKLQERAEKGPDDKFGQASVRLFAWIISQENWSLLSGFQMFADRGESDDWTVFKLERATEDSHRLFAPVGAWPEDLQQFSELFPRRHTLANAFFDAVPDTEVWQVLDEKGFLKRNVITTKQAIINFSTFLPNESLTDEIHETTEPITVTNIAFLTRDDIGIMDRVRQSQRLAHVFWRFLNEWLIAYDSKGLEINKALCQCNENHCYYPAEWLVSVASRKWVPLGERRSEYATAKSLADLFRGSGWEPSSLNENPSALKLLEAIGITRFDLIRAFGAANDEERKVQDDALTKMLVATGGNVNRLNYAHQYIEDLKNDDDLPSVLDERRERRRMIHENQRLGNQVEELVRLSLETEGFDVRRTGVGSDFEISYNSTETDDVARLVLSRAGRSWLIEVKATRDLDVRMTTTQAKTAVEQGSRFLLCVVPVALGATEIALENVRANMRFVENIGPRVEKLCADLDDLEGLRNSITAGGNFDVQLEVMSGTARVRVNSPVWQNDGFLLENLLNRLLK